MVYEKVNIYHAGGLIVERCFICNKMLNKINGSHLKHKHNINLIEYYVIYRNDLEFTKEEVLRRLYFKEKMSLKRICKMYEEKYNLTCLKPIILKLAKYYKFELRSKAESQKNFIKNSGGVWNKGLTKENNESVLKYSLKKKKLYEDLDLVLRNMDIPELLKIGLASKKIRNFFKLKLIEKQNNACLICNCDLTKISNENIHLHHIDRDINNQNEDNLCLLCSKCHSKISFFKYRIKEIDNLNTFDLLKQNSDLIKKIFKEKIKSKRNLRDKNYRMIFNYSQCFLCGSKNSLHLHHLNENPGDNREENICVLCHSHHSQVNGLGIICETKEELLELFKGTKKFNYKEYSKKLNGGDLSLIKLNQIKIKEFIQSKLKK